MRYVALWSVAIKPNVPFALRRITLCKYMEEYTSQSPSFFKIPASRVLAVTYSHRFMRANICHMFASLTCLNNLIILEISRGVLTPFNLTHTPPVDGVCQPRRPFGVSPLPLRPLSDHSNRASAVAPQLTFSPGPTTCTHGTDLPPSHICAALDLSWPRPLIPPSRPACPFAKPRPPLSAPPSRLRDQLFLTFLIFTKSWTWL